MIEPTPTNPLGTADSLQAQYQAIVHSLDNGAIRIELPQHLNVWVGNEYQAVTPVIAALQALGPNDRPEGLIHKHFPQWGDICWVDPGWFAQVPATLVSATVGDYIAIGPPDEPPDGLVDSVRKSDREVIEAFEVWMGAWKGQTLASDADEGEQGVQSEGHEADERSIPTRQSRKTTASLLGFAGMVAVVLFLAYDAFKIFLPYEITRREPIGNLVSAHTSDSGAYPWVLETDQGVYPMARALMVDKGAPLTLLALSNGRHLVCDETFQVCARTVGEDRRIKRKVDGQGER